MSGEGWWVKKITCARENCSRLKSVYGAQITLSYGCPELHFTRWFNLGHYLRHYHGAVSTSILTPRTQGLLGKI